LYHEVGAIAKVGNPLCDIDTPDDASAGSKPEAPAPPVPKQEQAIPKPVAPAATTTDDQLTFATPAVRRIAKENNVDIKSVNGTGPKGRVLKGDILQYVEQLKNGTSSPAPSVSPPIPSGEDKIVPLTAIQKAMFKSMTKSLSIPHFGFSDEVVVNRTTQLRHEINSYLKSLPKGTYPFEKISYMPIFLKALSEALKQYPILNSRIVDAESTPSLQYHHSHNIGIAMDTPQG
jgi:2-oxoisovalerate dehydrogenase E2 component (dihydrolipoyl transacylase)